MTKRKTCTATQMRQMLLGQAVDLGAPIPCALCKLPLLPHHKTIREHMHALGLDGPDTIENWALVHKECAHRKTYGTKATTYGSDIWEIAKGKRLRGETGQNKRKATIPSRPFQKTDKKRMPDGRVVPRG